MAKYGISREGISALQDLSSELSSFNLDIKESGDRLVSTVEGLEDDLGGFADQILGLVSHVNESQKNGEEAVDMLVGKIKKLASDIESLLSAGIK